MQIRSVYLALGTTLAMIPGADSCVSTGCLIQYLQSTWISRQAHIAAIYAGIYNMLCVSLALVQHYEQH